MRHTYDASLLESIPMTAATFPRPFVPIAELPGCGDPELGTLETPEFGAKVRAVLETRRRQGMNLVVARDGDRVVKIAPDGTETDVTAEATHRVEAARKRMGRAT